MIKEFFQTNKKLIVIVGLVVAIAIATMCFVFAASPKTETIDTGAISSEKDSSAESSSELISSVPVVVVPDIKTESKDEPVVSVDT